MSGGIGIAGGGIILGGGGAAGPSGVVVENAESVVSAAATTLDFDDNFIVTETPAGEANVAVRWNSIDTPGNYYVTVPNDAGLFVSGDIEWTCHDLHVQSRTGGSRADFYLSAGSVEFDSSGTGRIVFNTGTGGFLFYETFGRGATLQPDLLTVDRTLHFPDADGTFALTSDIPAAYTDEQARDAIGTALVPGNNIDITVNDLADTITIDVEALTSADLSDFTEAAQDAVGGMVADGTSVGLTYVDATPSLTANIKIASEAQGDIIYHNGTQWTRLGAGTSGHFLKTQGAAANPTWAAAAGGGGLVYITKSTFTTASSVSLDNCFSSTYENYRIIANVTAISGASVTLGLRLRVSSTDNSDASSYREGWIVYISNGSSGNSSGASTRLGLTFLDDSACVSHITLDVLRPAVADDTHFTGFATRGKPTDHGAMNALAGLHDASTAFDGFTLFPSTGTFTGTVYVYGYAVS